MTNKAPHFDDCGRFVHPRSIPACLKDGTHGIGVFLLKGNLGRWFCADHYKQHERVSKTKSEPRRPLPKTEKQGRLF